MSATARISGLAWALLDFVWQGALVGCAAAVLLGLMGKARPQWRYLVACGALLLCAALPLAHESEGQRRARASMDEIGKCMDEAGKPMDALGKKMDALGKQMDRESKAADNTMRGLIRDAMAKGLAQQAPGQG